MRSLLTFILLILLFVSSNAQQKFEQEVRVDESEVPTVSVSFVSSVTGAKKVKWYKEESQNGISLEAKFKVNKTKYSVEFDTEGNLLDAEIERKIKTLRTGVQDKLVLHFEEHYSRYKIKKCQIQYSGNSDDILAALNGQESIDLTIRYELIVTVQEENGWNTYEITFDTMGTVISKLLIIELNTDHLDF
jgi:hypothetical protein